MSRELFAAAQQVAPRRRGSRSGPGLNRHPQTRRSYPLRSLVTCALCGRRMRGKLRRKARREYLYYACEPPRSVGRQVAADRQPEHPASVLVRGDVLLAGVLEVFARRLFSPQRRALLAQDLPKVAGGEVAAWEARVQALQRAVADLQGRQARLVRTLEERDDPSGTLLRRSLGGSGNWTASSKPTWPSCAPFSANGPVMTSRRWTCWSCFPCSRRIGWPRRLNRCCAPCSSGSSCRSATTSRRTGRPSGSRSATTAWTAC